MISFILRNDTPGKEDITIQAAFVPNKDDKVTLNGTNDVVTDRMLAMTDAVTEIVVYVTEF